MAIRRKAGGRKSTAKSRRKGTSSTSKSKVNKSTGRKSGSATARGKNGFAIGKEKRARQEEEYQKRLNTPFDFWLKPGSEAEIVILDHEEPFFVSLHKVKVNGRWTDEVCIADTGETCPLCESENREGSYTLVLTCLDRRPYTTKAGKTIKASKKLLKVKGRNLPKFERAYDRFDGNLRGVRLLARRDGEKESGMGEDLEFLGRIPEARLKKYKEIAQPADYSEIFEVPSAEELRKRHGIKAGKVAGSEEFGNDDDDGDDGDYDAGNVDW